MLCVVLVFVFAAPLSQIKLFACQMNYSVVGWFVWSAQSQLKFCVKSRNKFHNLQNSVANVFLILLLNGWLLMRTAVWNKLEFDFTLMFVLTFVCLSSCACLRETTVLGRSHSSWGSDMWFMLSSFCRSLRCWRDPSLTPDRRDHENSNELPLNASSTSVDADNNLTIKCSFVMWS